MNSCILMAQIVSDPELRSTQDNVNVSTMLVEFESTREGEPPGKLKVEAWGRLAEEMKNSYSAGNQVIIEGRLSMNLIDMPEGYKQKVAKLVASRIYPFGASVAGSSYQASENAMDFSPSPQPQSPAYAAPEPESIPEPTPASGGNEDWDEIPF